MAAGEIAEVFRTSEYVSWEFSYLRDFRLQQTYDDKPDHLGPDHGGGALTYSNSLWMELHSDGMGEAYKDINVSFDVEHHGVHFHYDYQNEDILVREDWQYAYRNVEIDSITFRDRDIPGCNSYRTIRIASEYEYRHCRYGWWGCDDWENGDQTVDCDAENHNSDSNSCHTHDPHDTLSDCIWLRLQSAACLYSQWRHTWGGTCYGCRPKLRWKNTTGTQELGITKASTHTSWTGGIFWSTTG